MITAERVRQLEYQLYSVQDDFVHDPSRYVAFVAGRNSGKTYSGSIKALLKCMEPTLGVIAAPNFPMLEQGARRQFLQRLDESGLDYVTHVQKGTLYIPSTGAEVIFATLESESRVRGPNFDWGWPDELDYLADHEIWRALKGAVRSGDSPQIFATSTPKGRRLIWDEWVNHATPHHQLYRATTYDNPFIDAADYVSGLGYEGRYAEQEINAEFVSFEGAVYPMFNRLKHVTGEVDVTGWTTTLSVDVGTRNPTAILTHRIASDGRRHIEREVYRSGMSSDEITDTIGEEADRVKAEVIYLDPSANDYILALQRKGYPARKANNDITFGIGRVTTAFADGLTINPVCINLITEIEGYHYPDNRLDSDKPVKAADHACDALRYGIASESPLLEGNLVF